MKNKKLPEKLKIDISLQNASMQQVINESARVMEIQGEKINEIIDYLESEQ